MKFQASALLTLVALQVASSLARLMHDLSALPASPRNSFRGPVQSKARKKGMPYLRLAMPFLGAAICGALPCTAQTIHFEGCATDPVYKAFEQIQFEAAVANPSELRIFDIPTADNNGSTIRLFKGFQRESGSLPTCYEIPGIYEQIAQYVEKIERARKELRLPLPRSPKFGTLPTSELNAFTIPFPDRGDSIVALNSDLLLFNASAVMMMLETMAMTGDAKEPRETWIDAILKAEGNPVGVQAAQVAVAALLKRFQEPGGIRAAEFAVDPSEERAAWVIAQNARLRQDFAKLLIEFLFAKPGGYGPRLEQARWSVVYAEPMGMFEVGHEYGHVIKKHRSPTSSLRLDTMGSSEPSAPTFPVLTRSWSQELEADQIGAQLLIQAMHDEGTANHDAELWLDRINSAVFFFKCLQIVDEARYILYNGAPPPIASVEEQVYLRAIADGAASTDQKAKHASIVLSDHPPAWLRMERIRDAVESFLSRPEVPETAAVKNVPTAGLGLVNNIDLLWKTILPKFPLIVAAALKDQHNESPNGPLPSWKAMNKVVAQLLGPDQVSVPSQVPRNVWHPEPGCEVSQVYWLETFLCNSALQQAVIDFRDHRLPDTEIIELYRKAVERDWFLLSGAQVPVAEEALKNEADGSRDLALSLLALSGEKHALLALKSSDTTRWSPNERLLLEAAEQFLERYGRQTPADPTDHNAGGHSKRSDLLCFPEPLQHIVAIDALIPKSKNPLREDRVWAIWASLLLRTGRIDAALAYAPADTFGATPSLDLPQEMRTQAMEHFTKGSALAAESRYDTAISEFRRAIEAAPDYPDAHLNLSRALVASGERQAAITECHLAAKQIYTNERIYMGELLDEQKLFVWAIPQYRSAIRIDRDNLRARLKLAADLDEQREFDEAISGLREAIQLAPNVVTVHRLLSVVLVDKGDLKSAIDEDHEAIRLDPNLPAVHNHLGAILRKTGQLNDAITELRSAIQLDPTFEPAHDNLGMVLKDQGQAEGAIVEFKEAIRLKPDDPAPHQHLAWLLFDEGRKQDSIAEYRQVVRLKPNDAAAHRLLANVLEQNAMREEAIDEYRNAARIQPNDAVTHVGLGNLFAKVGQLDGAIVEYKTALKIESDNGKAHQFLATVYLRQKRFQEAISEYREATRLMPADAIAHAQFAVALEKGGERQEAAFEARTAHELDSTDENIRKIYESIIGPHE